MKKIKMLLASCLAIAMLFALTACQPTVVVNRYLDINAETLGYYLMSDGEFHMTNYSDVPEEWPDYNFDEKNQLVKGREWEDRVKDITKVIVDSKVLSIGANAFYGASALTELTIGPDVVSIGDNALKNCYNLKKINIDSNNENFAIQNNCLVELATGKLIRALDVANVKLNSSINEIEDGAFYGHKALKSVDLSETGIVAISPNTFKECASLTTVKLPAGLQTIGEGAFFRCKKLSSINVSECEALNLIGTNAFFGCESLKSIELPASLTRIGILAFSKCGALETITVNNVNSFSVGANAFYESDNIKNVYFNGVAGLSGLTRASLCGYLTATTYKCSSGVVNRNISVYIAANAYDSEKVGSYLTNGENYTKLDENKTHNEVEYVVFTAKR